MLYASTQAFRGSMSSLLCVLAFAGTKGCDSDSRPNSRTPTNADTWRIQDQQQAIARTIELVGLCKEAAPRITATLVTLADDNTPFLSEQVVHRPLWRVTINRWRLELDSAAPAFEDPLEQTLDVLLFAETGKLVKITSRWPEGIAQIPEEPPARRAEEQMQQSGQEAYHDFPSTEPTITFVQAVDAVSKEGFGSPLQAKQIVANYVLQSRMGGERRAVWAITLRGIHMVWPGGPPGVAPRVLNRMRNIVDATTGQWLLATIRPQPCLGSYVTQEPDILPDVPPTVTLTLSSPSGTVSRGQLVEWTISATVSVGDNDGLSMISVDLLQDPSNPALLDMPAGNRPVALQDFDRPRGISNPAMTSYGSAYGGTQIGAPGVMKLSQIGGAQNTFGAVGDGMGSDTVVDSGVGQGPGGQVIATGAFLAPCTLGEYKFSIDSGLANVLELEQEPSLQFSLVRSADVLYSEVQGGCGNCDEPNGGLGCSDPVCQDIVCLLVDPFCCSVGWDQLCANEALEHCECDDTNSPFTFTVTGSLDCPLDITGPSGGALDGKIAINDFLELLAFWGFDDVDADFIAPLGVGKEDLDLLLYYWGACPCTGLSPPPPLQYEMTCRGMDWPNDWNTFMECVTNGTPDEQSSCACWLKHYLEQECEVPPGIEMGMMGPGVTPPPPCPGDDPFGIQPSPG